MKNVLWLVAGLVAGVVVAAVAIPIVWAQNSPFYSSMSAMMRQAAATQQGQQMLNACTNFMQGYFSDASSAR
jgi:uncharacterized membrane protein